MTPEVRYFTLDEVRRALQDYGKLTAGEWAIVVEFGQGATTLDTPKGKFPTSVVSVQRIGLERQGRLLTPLDGGLGLKL